MFIGGGSTPVVRNNIVAGHAVGIHYDGTGSRTVYFNLLTNTINYSGNVTGTNDLIAAPRLHDDVHLAPDSPAIDAGEMATCVPTTDFDGQPRPLDGDRDGITVVDIGADEADVRIYLPIILRNSPATGFEYNAQECLVSTATAWLGRGSSTTGLFSSNAFSAQTALSPRLRGRPMRRNAGFGAVFAPSRPRRRGL